MQQRDALKASLVQIGDMRPGSLVGRFRKCGKPTCHCADPHSPGHGPSWSLTHPVNGKTVTRIIPDGPMVERAQQQIAEHRRFKKLVADFVGVQERLCDAQLDASGSVDGPADEKKGSTPKSRRGLSKKPKRS
jgi:hypothetical protein